MGYKPQEMEQALEYIKELEAESKDWQTAFKEERQERIGVEKDLIEEKILVAKHMEENEKLQEGNKKRFDKIKGLEYQLKQEKEKKPDEPIVIKDSDIKRANKNLSKQLETEKDRVNQVLTALECWKEENTKLKEENKKLKKQIEGVTICLTSVAECLNK